MHRQVLVLLPQSLPHLLPLAGQLPTTDTMTTKQFNTTAYVVAHGNGNGTVVEVPAGSKISTGQPNIEDFPTPEEAANRALEVGIALDVIGTLAGDGKLFNPITKAWIERPADDQLPDWTGDGSYGEGALVLHQGQIWLHISDRQGEPDGTYDLARGTGDWIPLCGYSRPEPEPVDDTSQAAP